MSESTLADAQSYARDRQWQIFPVDSAAKEPHITNWGTRATDDAQALAHWWRKWPDAGIGIATGPRSGLCVIDLDSDDARDILLQHGDLPPTLTALTGKGKHLYYRTVDNLHNRINFLGNKDITTRIDVRCAGGYVIAPPSLHHSGKLYQWEDPTVPIAPLPEWLAFKIEFEPHPKSKATPAPRSKELPAEYCNSIQQLQLALLRNAPDGTKHGALLGVSMRIAGLVKAGWSDEETQTEAMIQALAENATPPKDYENVKKTIASAMLKAKPEHPLNEFHTEYDLALRFAREVNDLKHMTDSERWLRYNSITWEDCPPPVLRVGEMVACMMDAPPTPGTEPDKHVRSLRRFHTLRALGAIATMASRTQDLALKYEELDQDPHLFNVQNGTVDLHTGTLRPHDPADLMTLVSPYPFDPKAPYPLWNRALAQYTGGDQDLAQYLQRLTGSCLVRQVVDEKIWLFRGDGSNGKSAFLKAVTTALGPYAKPTTASSVSIRQFEPHSSTIGVLRGCGLTFLEELGKDEVIDADKLKKYYGANPFLTQLDMRTSWVSVTPTWKLIISSNHDPQFPDSTKGARKRFTVVPFDQEIAKVDLRFTQKLLKAEGPGILRWLVEGARAYLENGLGTCKAVELRTAQFHADQDPLTDFLSDCCIIESGLSTPFRALYCAYADYCIEGHEKPLTKKAMGALLSTRGFAVERTKSYTGRAGLALKKDLAQQYQVRVMSS